MNKSQNTKCPECLHNEHDGGCKEVLECPCFNDVWCVGCVGECTCFGA